jgi:hypothetical protein
METVRYILWPFLTFFRYSVYFMAISKIVRPFWYILLWPFVIYFPILVCCDKKNIPINIVLNILQTFFSVHKKIRKINPCLTLVTN